MNNRYVQNLGKVNNIARALSCIRQKKIAYHDMTQQLTHKNLDVWNLFMTQELLPAAFATA